MYASVDASVNFIKTPVVEDIGGLSEATSESVLEIVSVSGFEDTAEDGSASGFTAFSLSDVAPTSTCEVTSVTESEVNETTIKASEAMEATPTPTTVATGEHFRCHQHASPNSSDVTNEEEIQNCRLDSPIDQDQNIKTLDDLNQSHDVTISRQNDVTISCQNDVTISRQNDVTISCQDDVMISRQNEKPEICSKNENGTDTQNGTCKHLENGWQLFENGILDHVATSENSVQVSGDDISDQNEAILSENGDKDSEKFEKSSKFEIPPKAQSADPLYGDRYYFLPTSLDRRCSSVRFDNDAKDADKSFDRDARASARRKFERQMSPSVSADFNLLLVPPPSPPELPINNNNNNAEISFESELKFSQFDPANFQTLFLPGTGNKPLDPLAVRAIHRTLTEMSAESLAAHLVKTDLDFLGLSDASQEGFDTPCSFPESESSKTSKLFNLFDTSEVGRQFRQDALDRCLCLRTLVMVTILTAPNLSESAKILSCWIQIADQVQNHFGDRFAFFNIVSVLCLNKHLQRWRDLWAVLNENFCIAAKKLETVLRPQLNILNEDDFEATTVPNILQVILQFAHQQPRKSFLIDLQREVMSTQQLIDVSATCRFPEYEDLFRKNGSEYFSQLDGGAAIYEQLLMDLFRTEFHVKLLWGSGSGVQEFPQNFEIRHSKFSKVIHTLVAICTKT